MATATILTEIFEGTTGTYSATLKDETDVAITGLPFTGVRISYYSKSSGNIVNSRNNQNILNLNNVTITAAGAFSWKLQEADVTVADSPKPDRVTHRAEIVVEWNDVASGPRQTTHVVDIPIKALTKAPLSA